LEGGKYPEPLSLKVPALIFQEAVQRPLVNKPYLEKSEPFELKEAFGSS
jgi:hypothetical protein